MFEKSYVWCQVEKLATDEKKYLLGHHKKMENSNLKFAKFIVFMLMLGISLDTNSKIFEDITVGEGCGNLFFKEINYCDSMHTDYVVFDLNNLVLDNKIIIDKFQKNIFIDVYEHYKMYSANYCSDIIIANANPPDKYFCIKGELLVTKANKKQNYVFISITNALFVCAEKKDTIKIDYEYIRTVAH